MFKLYYLSKKLLIININHVRYYSSKPSFNALFFGSDEFSLYSLKLLYSYCVKSELFNKLEVVTNVTKKANPIQAFAEKQKLPLHNWPHVPAEGRYDVGLVVSFGYLIPQNIIEQFPYGILNVHGSLLPRWRGAAPIIYALAKGDTETGVTIMRIKPHTFDTGDILLQEKIVINENTEMPELHRTLGELGAKCLVRTLEDLPTYMKQSKPQADDNATYAPKVNPDFAVVNWNEMSAVQVYDLHRALKGFLMPTTTWQQTQIKLSEIKLCNINSDSAQKPGYVKYDKRTKLLYVLCADNAFVSVESVGVLGKKIMTATEFNNGFLCKVSTDLRCFK